MKTKLLLTATLWMLSLSLANGQVIPNYNFENWTNGANAAPDGWTEGFNNPPGFYPVTQTTDKYLGTYAVRIENKITATDTTGGQIFTTTPGGIGGFDPAFPIATRYNNLKGFYKYAPLNGDSAQVIVYITKTGYVGPWGNLLAWGQKTMGAAVTYTPFSVGYKDSLTTFAYFDGTTVPDSAYINIYAWNPFGATQFGLPPLGNSVLYVDALNFDSYLVGINEQSDITSHFHFLPTVSSGNFEVKFETMKNEYTTIKVYDLEGREVKSLFNGNLAQGNHSFQYDWKELCSGMYLYVIATGSGYKAEKFCIE